MIQDAFIRLRAKQLYWQGYPPAEISRLMGINSNTVYSWKKRDAWDDTTPIKRVTQSIDTRLCQLSAKDNKTSGDFKEIDLLTRQLKKLDTGQAPLPPALKNQSSQEEKSLLRGADRGIALKNSRLSRMAPARLVRTARSA
jgi:transposase-like protein